MRVRHVAAGLAVAAVVTVVGASLDTNAASSPPDARTALDASPSAPAPDSPEAAGDKGVVYLTFDDGPGPATPKVLSILDRTGSTATFFQLGSQARGQQRVQEDIRAQGSNIGNHSYSHRNLTKLSSTALKAQIDDGVEARCFRPPYGATNSTVRRALDKAGARQVLWTIDTRDWARPGTKAIKRFGKSSAVEDGSIILMHDGGGDRSQTVAALPALIKSLQERGYAVRALPYC